MPANAAIPTAPPTTPPAIAPVLLLEEESCSGVEVVLGAGVELELLAGAKCVTWKRSLSSVDEN